jgi:hypothetical protein
MCYVTKRLLAHSEPQLQSHKVLTGALIKGCHLGMPTGQATSDRALATLNKFCRQEQLGGGGEVGSRQVFSTWYAGARRREQLRTLRGPDGNQSMQLPN